MKKVLLYLDEDLASSMALRFAAAHARGLDMALQPFHVVARGGSAPDGLGWVSRSREKMELTAGLDEVQRLMRTENIAFPCAGEPRIALGDRDREVLRELADGEYSLYAEGYLSREEPGDFRRFLGAERFRHNPCPVLLVKNLVDHAQLLLLLDRATDIGRMVSGLTALYGTAAGDLDLTVLYSKHGQGTELVFQERKKVAILDRAAQLLADNGWNEPEWLVVQGPPARTAEYMRGHGLVAATFPGRPDWPGVELLAHLTNPVLLFPELRTDAPSAAEPDPEPFN